MSINASQEQGTGSLTPKCLIVISHYNAWKSEYLLNLLNQITTMPAGYEYDILIAVNKGVEEQLILPSKYKDIKIIYHENKGFNMGAWNFGWQKNQHYQYYCFLQDECILLKENWLLKFVEANSNSKVLIGESLLYSVRSEVIEAFDLKAKIAELDKQYNITTKLDYQHLQSLLLFTSNEVMHLIEGFPCSENEKGAGVAAEIAISRIARARGVSIKQIAFYPFEFIQHPQWVSTRTTVKSISGTLRRLSRICANYFK